MISASLGHGDWHDDSMPVVIATVSALGDEHADALRDEFGDTIELHDFRERRDELATTDVPIEVVFGMVRPQDLAGLA